MVWSRTNADRVRATGVHHGATHGEADHAASRAGPITTYSRAAPSDEKYEEGSDEARKSVLLFLAVLCVSVSAEAVGPTATAQFYVKDLETHKRTPALESTAGSVCLSYRSKPGWFRTVNMTLQLTIYDGEGREVHKSAIRR